MKRILFAALLGMSSYSAAMAQPAYGPPVTPRYQIVFSPHARADVFLLDIQAGSIWQLVKISDVVGEPPIWIPMQRINNAEEFAAWNAAQIPKSSQTTTAPRAPVKPK